MSGIQNPFLRLTQEHVILPFDCGNKDLNDFLLDDSKAYLRKYLAVTYLIENEGETVLFFTLSNDKISSYEQKRGLPLFSNSFFRKLKSNFDRSKYRQDYPAVKIGRLGVNLKYQHTPEHWGSLTLDFIKEWMVTDNKTGCCYITVDAYASAVEFYKRNGFEFMGHQEKKSYYTWLGQGSKKSDEMPTFAMYFNLILLHP